MRERSELLMPGVDKVIEKMKRQPNGISMAEARKVLEANGYSLARQKGSHCHYINAEGDVITIKKENPLKAVYVKDILRRID
jgi:predicted RNA binding protein YcfA (HicA-like mRNA interferase family)